MFIRSNDDEAYYEGSLAAVRAVGPLRMPTLPPWKEVAPEWALEPTLRGHSWIRGFANSWNCFAGRWNWPEWAHMRFILPLPPKE